MFVLRSEVSIGSLFFEFTNEVKIKSAWRNLTDTCTIKIPRNITTLDGVKIDEAVKAGDLVSVKHSYQGFDLPERFAGYVSGFNAATAVFEITCEDEMWKMKQTTISKSWPDANLEDVIKHIKTATNSTWEYEILGDRVQIGQVKFEKLSAAKCFLELKDKYGIYCFFRSGKLIVGKPYEPDSSKRNEVELEYGRNVISWKDLVYKKSTEVKLKVTIVNHAPDGSKKEFTVGDEGGEERTLDFYNRKESELKAEAQGWLDKLKYDGYHGKLLLFGEPVVKHGDVVVIKDWRYPEREGKYFVDSVEDAKTTKSIRQLIEIGPKAA